MHPAPVVAVVVPAYQVEDCLARALDSVLAQTLESWELVIVDDGSTDGTADVARRYVGDPRVRLIQKTNGGLAAARNTGLEAVTAPAVLFLDADDELLPQKLERQLPTMVACDVSYADCYEIEEATGRSWRLSSRVPAVEQAGDTLAWLLANPNPIQVVGVIVRTDALRRIGGFDPERRIMEDIDCWVRLAEAGCTFSYLPEALANYFVRDGSISATPEYMFRSEAAWADEVAHRLQGHHARLARRRRDHLLAMQIVLDRRRKPVGARATDLIGLARRRPAPGTLATQALYTLSPGALGRLRPTSVDGRGFVGRRLG